MRLEFAFLADAANTLENGLFDVVSGGFDVIVGNSFPATQSAIVLVARVLFDPEECGKQHDFRGQIVDENGNAIFPEMHVSFTAPPHPRRSNRPNWMTVCLKSQAVAFPAPGDYFFRLSLDKKPIGEVIIEVVLEGDHT